MTRPNPQAESARAAMREYYAQMLRDAIGPEPTIAPDVEQDEAEARYMNACFDQWPDMRCYADTAQIEPVYDAQRDCWREAVTVTVFAI